MQRPRACRGRFRRPFAPLHAIPSFAPVMPPAPLRANQRQSPPSSHPRLDSLSLPPRLLPTSTPAQTASSVWSDALHHEAIEPSSHRTTEPPAYSPGKPLRRLSYLESGNASAFALQSRW